MTEAREVAAPTLMPPYRVYRGFLDEDTRTGLLAWTLENQTNFEPSVLYGDKHDPTHRVSLRLGDFGPIMELLRQRVFDLVPTLIKDLRVTPFEVARVEIELVAHNDGAFFKRHIDTVTGRQRKKPSDRVLSAVYYFHAEPKAFSGGALRLYPFGAKEDESNFVDVQPEQGTFVAFPSWVPHEVLPVSCPSKHFSDLRFNVNFWVHRHSNSIVA